MNTEIDGSKDYYSILGLDKDNLGTVYETAKEKIKKENDAQIANEKERGKRQTTVKLTPREIEIKAEAYVYSSAYKKIALQQHPDKGGDAEKFKQTNAAYDILKDPEKRREYDKKRKDFLKNPKKKSGPETKGRARREGTEDASQGKQKQQENPFEPNSSQHRYGRPQPGSYPRGSQQQDSDEENRYLKKVIDDWERAYQSLEESNNSAKEENKDLRKVIDNWKNAYQSLKESNNSAKEENKDLRKVIDDWERAFQSLEESNNSAKEKNKDLRKVIDNWKNAFQSLEESNNSTKEENIDLRKVIDDWERAFQSLKESNNRAKEENKKLKNKNSVLSDEINYLREDYGGLKEENKELSEKLRKYEQEGDKKNRVNDLIIKIEGKIKELRDFDFELPNIKESIGYSNDKKKSDPQIHYDVEVLFFNKKKVKKYEFLDSIGKRISDNKHGLKDIDDRHSDLLKCERDIQIFYGNLVSEYNVLKTLYKNLGPREERNMNNFSNPQVVKNDNSRSSSPNGSTSRGVQERNRQPWSKKM
ncbi:DnaJ domain-containing protein [Zobellia galactanivorans]|uniref:DnaJ domain-containing protein n=1 Tax=Zobellia galactanivorans (strain DSM 12802 / CCUG 47099 / CIP 106680 / NCIMB 13871 / Dsij) TaxID=63186 RepID=UPI001C07C0B4|nr:DnaJ domain-containing protein [Zobellia galactanivorans]MBU3027926.1 DnaJ domain-containing protein [Zobellia galactanivorans]